MQEQIILTLNEKFLEVVSDPTYYLERPSELDGVIHGKTLKPFLVEAMAVGLTMRHVSLGEIKNTLIDAFNASYLPLIYVGAGFGTYLSRTAPMLDGSLEAADVHSFMNGYGFAMGTAYVREKREMRYPSSGYRSSVVRGLGRVVTFLPVERNSLQKFERYFGVFELGPEDRSDFYHGAAFSQTFVLYDYCEDVMNSYLDALSTDDNESAIRAGSDEAMRLRAQLV